MVRWRKKYSQGAGQKDREKKERKKEGRIKMGTGSVTYGERKRRTENRGEGLSKRERDAD